MGRECRLPLRGSTLNRASGSAKHSTLSTRAQRNIGGRCWDRALPFVFDSDGDTDPDTDASGRGRRAGCSSSRTASDGYGAECVPVDFESELGAEPLLFLNPAKSILLACFSIPEGFERIANTGSRSAPRVHVGKGNNPGGVEAPAAFAPRWGADSITTPSSPGACFARPGAIGSHPSGMPSRRRRRTGLSSIGQGNLEKAVGTTDCPDNTDKQGLGLNLSHTSKVSGLP